MFEQGLIFCYSLKDPKEAASSWGRLKLQQAPKGKCLVTSVPHLTFSPQNTWRYRKVTLIYFFPLRYMQISKYGLFNHLNTKWWPIKNINRYRFWNLLEILVKTDAWVKFEKYWLTLNEVQRSPNTLRGSYDFKHVFLLFVPKTGILTAFCWKYSQNSVLNAQNTANYKENQYLAIQLPKY